MFSSLVKSAANAALLTRVLRTAPGRRGPLRRRRARPLAGVPLLGVGAALAYFLDPAQGKRRRKMAAQRAGATFRRVARGGGRAARRAASQTEGVVAQATHAREAEEPPPDDVTLARKAETELFRDPDVPKGAINISAVNGVVELRGEARTPEQITGLEAKAREIPGVNDVRNLLHLPGTPPPPS